jgi:hypothetical protein
MRASRTRGHARLFAVAAAVASAASPTSVSGAPGETCDDPIPIAQLPFITLDSTTGRRDDLPLFPGAGCIQDPLVGQGPDVVFVLQPQPLHADSVVFYAAPRDGWDLTLSLRAQDCRNGPCVGGADARGPGGFESIAIAAVPGVPLFLVVDGVAGGAGEFSCIAYERGDTLCHHLIAPALMVTQNVAKGAGPREAWKAETSPTHRILAPEVCHRTYEVPWPRVAADGSAIWITNARAEGGFTFLGLPLPSSATAIVQLFGSYTVSPKPPGVLRIPIPCQANFEVSGRQIVITRDAGDWAQSTVSARVLVQPFFDPPWWPASTRTCPQPPDAAPECHEAEPWAIASGVVPGDVPSGIPQIVDLVFQSRARATGGGFARGAVHRFDLDIECIDPPAGLGDQALAIVRPRLDIERVLVTPQRARQGADLGVLAGFTAEFVPVDSAGTPGGLAPSLGHGFAAGLFVTRSAELQAAFADSVPPDTSVVATWAGGALSPFAGPVLHAPSDLEFDPHGGFAYGLHAAAATAFDPQTGQPAYGSGVVARITAGGAQSVVAAALHSPVALAFAPGAPWDSALYVAEIAAGRLSRVTAGGVVTTFASDLALPTDLAFAGGGWGDVLVVTEADTVAPDSLRHANAGRLSILTPAAGRTTRVAGLHLPTAVVATDPAGPLGGDVFVAVWNALDAEGLPVPQSGRILRIDAAGGASDFVTGLEQPTRLAYAPPQDLYVAVAGGFVHVTVEDPTDAPPPREAGAPRVPLLLDAAPNPFNPTTVLRFETPERRHLRLDVFDAGGRRLRTLADRDFAAGVHRVLWDGTGARGARLASGVYVARLRGRDGSEVVTRLVLVR